MYRRSVPPSVRPSHTAAPSSSHTDAAATRSQRSTTVGEHRVVQFAASHSGRESLEVVAPSPADDPLLYFTCGTTSLVKLEEHTNFRYPVGHLSTMYWIGLEPGDIHINVASPDWVKHAWSDFPDPFIAGATVFLYNYSRFDAVALMDHMDREGVTSVYVPPTVWRMLIKSNLSHLKHSPRKRSPRASR